MPDTNTGIQPSPENRPTPQQADIVSPDHRQAHITTRSWRGPLPTPDDFRGYDEILPGAAERILALAERQAAHRHNMEKAEVAGQYRRSFLGLFAGFVVAVTALGLGGFLINSGHDWAGGLVVGADLVGLTAVFVYGSHSRQSASNRDGSRRPSRTSTPPPLERN
jgi:uncharacterized membrane protein